MLLPSNASKQQLEEWAERSAIKEFEAGMSREQAEKEAFDEIFLKRKQGRLL